MQTRLESIIETVVSTTIGYLVAVASQVVIFPMFGIHVPFSTNFIIAVWFTVISLIRGYLVRRLFNKWRFRRAN